MNLILFVDVSNGAYLLSAPINGEYPVPHIGTTVRYNFTPTDGDQWDPESIKACRLAGEGEWYVQSVTHEYTRLTVDGPPSYKATVGLSRQKSSTSNQTPFADGIADSSLRQVACPSCGTNVKYLPKDAKMQHVAEPDGIGGGMRLVYKKAVSCPNCPVCIPVNVA